MANVELSKREAFILGAALRYAKCNLDDLNEAFEDDESEGVIVLNSGDLFGTFLEEAEVEALAEKMIDAGSAIIE